MKTSSALLSLTTLSIVLFKFGVSASPVLAKEESADAASSDLLIRGPFLPGTEGSAAENKLLLRADSYGWDHHRKHRGWRRELDATTKGTSKSNSQHYGPHHYHHHWWHHHHYKYPRDDNDEGAPEDNVDIDGDTDSAMATQMKREDAYGRHWHYHHHKGYYPRDDSDSEKDFVPFDNDKREEGYSRHHYHKKHGYGYYRRDESGEDGALSPFDNEKREDGYSRHHYHKKHGYYRRDDTDPEDSLGPVDQDRREEGYYRHHHYPKYHYPRDGDHVEGGLLDERDEDAAQRHRHYKYPRDTDHWGRRWRHHHKFFHREDTELPSDFDLEAIAERDVEHRYHHPYHKHPRDLVSATNADKEEGHPKKATAEDIKEGVAHGVTTGAKETAAGILGFDL